MANSLEKIIASTFMDIAEGLETGSFGSRPQIAVTGMGSEHGEENAMEAALMAAHAGCRCAPASALLRADRCHHL